MPDDLTKREWQRFDPLYEQTLLLEQDVSQAIEEKFLLDEFGVAENRKAWFIHGNVRNTAALFRQELLALARRRFPWATSVELKLSLDKEEPYQYVYLTLWPLPSLP